MKDTHTMYLRMEGPLQAWGDTSKFVIRRTMEAPTKSGVIGLICCAMGLSRAAARERLEQLNALCMGVRVDRPGMRWWDYHTVGAGIGLTTAGGGIKTGAQGTLITRREYLADASFLVAVQGDKSLIDQVASALAKPKWPLYLGRKSCPPSVPILVTRSLDGNSRKPYIETGKTLSEALWCMPWQPRIEHLDKIPDTVACILEWRQTEAEMEAPEDAEVWYDVPVAFDPPVHHARFVMRQSLTVGKECDVKVGASTQLRVSRPTRPGANYTNAEWTSKAVIEVIDRVSGEINQLPKGMRPRRLAHDHHLCVFCKAPANTVQHITYRNAGGNEAIEDLASLCRLCHDACTMLEYGHGMGIDRIDPSDIQWREQIIEKRDEIIRFRSVATRKRKLQPEEVE